MKSLIAAVLAVAAFARCTTTSASPSTPAPPAPAATMLPSQTSQAAENDLRIRVQCSEEVQRMAFAILEWPATPQLAQNQRVEATVFREGYERNWYAWMPALGRGKFEQESSLRQMGREPGRPFEIFAQPTRAQNDKWVAMEVRNLEPGVIYWWRLATRTEKGWAAGAPEPVQTPVCTADEARER